ncbi:glutamine--tRNA ligase/YqeY domain fusion protein [Oscillibacter sp.]|uniref:glutamine--tRNA ligase/YqeY domain fusion protein n=1 Tax=Oscillibacter sp. TaxID=1945593 RepID=UPI001B46DCB0|nr:glutamine--tRNA ligase/YqeY domain fusion protein [Oscillibacter sp.]MBP3509913.1 glutamine--tRNA ligase/YqeY domain fusion protein [Oscillibacter sp.]
MADEIKTTQEEVSESRNFIHAFIEEDIAPGGQFEGMTVHTRFPPEPNGYLHIGHCKALTIDFGTAEKFGGLCNLRMDDTNPTKEDTEFVDAIQEDIHWLGFDWGDRFFYGSDYFEEDYRQAVGLIKKGLAYVCELSPEEFKEYRGSIGVPAKSPYRDRPIEESLDLFARMRAGEFPNGAMTLRAKIDLASGNFNMRDPVLYRINHMHHHRQGDKWCIYPMYDFAHPIQDALEGITHSLCSLEFEAHRPLYNWVVDNCDLPSKPRQIEFARLGIDHTVMSKRKLRALVESGKVSGWDDPRMPTLCGLRRRGYTAKSIRNFCERIGVAKSANVVEYGFLEHCLREDLNETAERVMGVLRPIKLTITNYPEGKTETVTVENNPLDPTAGTREVSFSRDLYIEADDFLETPVPKYKRLFPGGPECRLKGAYLITCTGCLKDENGNITEVLCEYDPESRGGDPADGRKVKGATIHWVDAATAIDAEVRLYDNLFSDEAPDSADKDFIDCLNPNSLEVLQGCKVEASLKAVAQGYEQTEKKGKTAPAFQFMRLGYFCMDSRDSSPEHMVFNRSVSLKDSFKK